MLLLLSALFFLSCCKFSTGIFLAIFKEQFIHLSKVWGFFILMLSRQATEMPMNYVQKNTCTILYLERDLSVLVRVSEVLGGHANI